LVTFLLLLLLVVVVVVLGHGHAGHGVFSVSRLHEVTEYDIWEVPDHAWDKVHGVYSDTAWLISISDISNNTNMKKKSDL
jgi:hypothetical protein